MKAIKDTTVLVVDDEAILRDAIACDFRRQGFRVLTASSGNDALRVIRSDAIDLVLSDVRMPDGNGVDLLRAIKDLSPATPVFMFITGFADLTLEEAYDEGADAVFSKPFNRKLLQEAALRALEPSEKRWKPRNERFEVELQISLNLPGIDTAVRAKVLNIGRGGMFVALDNGFPGVGAQVRFRIEVNDRGLGPIQGAGVVRWVREVVTTGRPRGCGIEFAFLDDACRTGIIELIKRARTKAFIPKA